MAKLIFLVVTFMVIVMAGLVCSSLHDDLTEEEKRLTHIEMRLRRRPSDPKPILVVDIPYLVVEAMKPKRRAYVDQVTAGLYAEALPKIEALIKEREALGLSNHSNRQMMILVCLDKVVALMRLNRNIEAIIETLKVKEMAKNHETGSRISKMLEELPKQLDDYEMLQLTKSATPSDAKRAYRKMALLIHPDKFPKLSPEDTLLVNAMFARLKEAYEHLTQRS